ncbi:TPA: hypothetical protein SMN36_000922 [Proteus mirabilis]|uniref:hypothetical protein n=1 Tax=Proteus mirabilis TaxID=584 RepID=UPI001B384BC6|nr:hypothetical protein [Proteus mirabilis]MBQ0303071.1 hypothetical protein [Proteus mirabilis]MCG9959838.1 hypothetical protein [Proteus mirabilis]HEJ9674664.1 hypothetical protein [Proteus mirabilis]
MNIYEKLKQIAKIEKTNLEINQNMSWLVVEGILQHRKFEKYSYWLTTGKILPEAGQVSPAIAHNGQ